MKNLIDNIIKTCYISYHQISIYGPLGGKYLWVDIYCWKNINVVGKN